MSHDAHDYVLVFDRAEYFQSLLKNANHEQFEIEWIREFVKALRCREVKLNETTTVSIVIFAGKAKFVSQYTPGSYTATEGTLNHYFELLKPTFLNDLNDGVLKELFKEWSNVLKHLYIEDFGNLNLCLQDLSLDGFLRIDRKRYQHYLQRLSLKTKTSTIIQRVRVLVVITGGKFNHEDCRLENAYNNRQFSGTMRKKSKLSSNEEDLPEPRLAWMANQCTVSKAVEYAYDYVFFNLVGTKESVQAASSELKATWSQSTFLETTLKSFETGYEDSVYKILDVCRSPSPKPQLLVIAIDESDSFNRRGRKGKPIHKIIRKWVNSLLREGKARFEESTSSLEYFKAIVVRFSGLNAPNEENGIGTQLLKEGLYHYEFAPQKLNGGFESSEPLYITAEEIDDNIDIFEPSSEELDGNSQFYLCMRDICFYLKIHPELDNHNHVLLVISDMEFDGIEDSCAEIRPLLDENKEKVDFALMKSVNQKNNFCGLIMLRNSNNLSNVRLLKRL